MAHPCAEDAGLAFFERQFRRQIAAAEYQLNPFEKMVLPFLRGSMVDLGCGLGNLSLEAAAQGAHVTALDACVPAIADLERRASETGLDVTAQAADLRSWRAPASYDTVACIGLLMFFPPREALAGLLAIRDAVKPGGIAAVNVLVEGTTYLAMFDPRGFHLFTRAEVLDAFAGWPVETARDDDFAAPAGTAKRFFTIVARRPAAMNRSGPR